MTQILKGQYSVTTNLQGKPNPYDREFYVIHVAHKSGDYSPEQNVCEMTEKQVVKDILTGQHENVVAVFAFNPIEGWSRDVSEDIAAQVLGESLDDDGEVPYRLKAFLEEHLGSVQVYCAERDHRLGC